MAWPVEAAVVEEAVDPGRSAGSVAAAEAAIASSREGGIEKESLANRPNRLQEGQLTIPTGVAVHLEEEEKEVDPSEVEEVVVDPSEVVDPLVAAGVVAAVRSEVVDLLVAAGVRAAAGVHLEEGEEAAQDPSAAEVDYSAGAAVEARLAEVARSEAAGVRLAAAEVRLAAAEVRLAAAARLEAAAARSVGWEARSQKCLKAMAWAAWGWAEGTYKT